MTHRFLWRDLDVTKEPEDYAMTVVNFGDKPSGTIAIIALKKTAEMGREICVKASESISKNSYMDDILESVETTNEAQTRMNLIDTMLGKGGFQIKKMDVNRHEQNPGIERERYNIKIKKRY